MRDESGSAVAALFTDDGAFWIADEHGPTGAAASGKQEIGQLFAGWFGAGGLRLAIEEPTHSVNLEEERLLQSGVFTRTITVRQTVTRSRSEAGTSSDQEAQRKLEVPGAFRPVCQDDLRHLPWRINRAGRDGIT